MGLILDILKDAKMQERESQEYYKKKIEELNEEPGAKALLEQLLNDEINHEERLKEKIRALDPLSPID